MATHADLIIAAESKFCQQVFIRPTIYTIDWCQLLSWFCLLLFIFSLVLTVATLAILQKQLYDAMFDLIVIW